MMRLAVAIVTVPIYIHHVGDARYGVISIVWILLGYFGFLDLGLSRASTNALSKLRDAPQPDRARVLRDGQVRRRFEQAAVVLAAQFDWSVVTAQFAEVLRRVTSGSSAGPRANNAAPVHR